MNLQYYYFTASRNINSLSVVNKQEFASAYFVGVGLVHCHLWGGAAKKTHMQDGRMLCIEFPGFLRRH